ncbi:MAG: hypothetical protein AAB691_02750 [Patescibacteria group bacterium]
MTEKKSQKREQRNIRKRGKVSAATSRAQELEAEMYRYQTAADTLGRIVKVLARTLAIQGDTGKVDSIVTDMLEASETEGRDIFNMAHMFFARARTANGGPARAITELFDTVPLLSKP